MLILGIAEHYLNSVFVNDHNLMFHEDYIIPLERNTKIQWHDSVLETYEFDSSYVHHYMNGFVFRNRIKKERNKTKELSVMTLRFDSNQKDIDTYSEVEHDVHWPCTNDYIITLTHEENQIFMKYEELCDVKGITDKEHLNQWIHNEFREVENVKVKLVGPQKSVQFWEKRGNKEFRITNEDVICMILNLEDKRVEPFRFSLSQAVGSEFTFTPNVPLRTFES